MNFNGCGRKLYSFGSIQYTSHSAGGTGENKVQPQ